MSPLNRDGSIVSAVATAADTQQMTLPTAAVLAAS